MCSFQLFIGILKKKKDLVLLILYQDLFGCRNRLIKKIFNFLVIPKINFFLNNFNKIKMKYLVCQTYYLFIIAIHLEFINAF
jgi:hypothetical protein